MFCSLFCPELYGLKVQTLIFQVAHGATIYSIPSPPSIINKCRKWPRNDNTESRKRKEVTPPSIPALPRDSVALPSPSDRTGGQGASASVQGIMESKGSKVLFAIWVEISWQRFELLKSHPPHHQEVWDSFYPKVELHRNSLAAGWDFFFFFFSFY